MYWVIEVHYLQKDFSFSAVSEGITEDSLATDTEAPPPQVQPSSDSHLDEADMSQTKQG